MTLRDRVDSRTKSPTVTVKFNGAETRDIISVDVSYSINGNLNSATIKTVSRPRVEPEGKVIITQGYDGEESLVFVGYVDSIQQDEFATSYTTSCRDPLKKAMDTFLVQEVKFGIDPESGKFYYSTYSKDIDGGVFHVHEYMSLSELNAAHPETVGNYSNEGVLAEAVVQWMLHMSGLLEGDEILVDSTNFWIGDLKPVTFHLQSVYDSIQQICDLIGWYVFSDVGGITRFKKRPRNASGYSVWKYRSNSEPFNIHSLSYNRTNTDLRNYVEIQGMSGIKVVRRANSPYIGNTPYRGVVVGNDLIDASGIATFMAARMLSDLNRLKESISLEVDGNPFLFPGQSIDVKSSAINGVFLVEELQSTVSADSGYRTTINAAAYPGDVIEEDDGNIEASFKVTQVISLGDPKICVQLDGSTSYGNRGAITEYEWTFEDDVYNKRSSSTSVWVVFDSLDITDGNTSEVTLKVYDTFGNTGTYMSGIRLENLQLEQPIMYRHLYAALTTKAAGSSDGGANWNMLDIPAISSAASGYSSGGKYVPTGYALFGGSDGNIYKTSDLCLTYTVTTTLDSAVNHVHIAENDSNYCLASCESGNVYKSIDAGVTWLLLKSFESKAKQAEYGFTNYDYIAVVTDSPNSGVYVTHDGGGNWIQLSDFGDLSMNWFAGGAITPYYAHTGGVVASRPEPDQLVFIDQQDNPNVIAMSVANDDDSGVMIVDSTGQHWRYGYANASGFIKTQYNPNNLTRHMVRDGAVSHVVYYATQSGIGKSIDGNKTMLSLLNVNDPPPLSPADSVGTNGWGESVSYGPLTEKLETVMGRIVIHAPKDIRGGDGSNSDKLYEFSGYDSNKNPIYSQVDHINSCIVILTSDGICSVDTSSIPVNIDTPIILGVTAAGPGYFIITSNRNNDLFPIPNGVSGLLATLCPYAMDFTMLRSEESATYSAFNLSSSSDELFIPKFHPIRWFPSKLYSHSGTGISLDILGIRIANDPRHNLARAGYTRFYAGYRYGMYPWAFNYVESFDIPRGSLDSDIIHTSNSNAVAIPNESGYPENLRMSEVSVSNTQLITAESEHLIGEWYSGRSIVKYDDSGTPILTYGGRVGLSSASSSVYNAAQTEYGTGVGKFSNGWSTPLLMNSDKRPVIVDSPDNIIDLNVPNEGGILSLHDSARYTGGLFAIDKYNVYLLPSYGMDSSETQTLYSVNSGDRNAGWYIKYASVTHNSKHTRDYISLVLVKITDSWDVQYLYDNKVVYSSDGGYAWEESKEIRTRGAFSGAWWIEP